MLKRILLVVGGLAILSLASCFGAAGYMTAVAPETFTQSDFEAGGTSFSAEEAKAFKATCQETVVERAPDKADAVCSCLTARAPELARFERLMFQSALSGNVRRVIAISRGAVGSGADQEADKRRMEFAMQRLKRVLQQCDPDQVAAKLL